MAAGDLVVAENQIELWRSDTDRLLLGATTNFHLIKVSGLDLPTIRANDFEKQSAHGSTPVTRDLLSVRDVTVSLLVRGTSLANLVTRRDELGKAVRPMDAPTTMTLRWPGRSRMRMLGRIRRAGWADEAGTNVLDLPADFVFTAHDPILYDHTETSTVITIGAASTSQSGTVTNNGTMPVNPTLTIVGPATNPRIQNTQDENRQIRIDVVLASSDTLVIDVARKVVELNGTDRYDLVRTDNQWWELKPGGNNITYIRSDSPAATSALTVKHRHGWDAI